MMIFWFIGLTVAAVGKTAGEVVKEVRRQFRHNPDIMTFKARPDYRTCVALVTSAALEEMVLPGLLATGLPIAVGLVFRGVGAMTGRPMLGAEALAGYLALGTVNGLLSAAFLDNVGGAWVRTWSRSRAWAQERAVHAVHVHNSTHISTNQHFHPLSHPNIFFSFHSLSSGQRKE